jgi:ComF family protein
MKEIRLGDGGPPGHEAAGASGWRAVTRVLRSTASMAGGALRAIPQDVQNLLFPSDCRVCGAPMVETAPVAVCRECMAGVSEQSGVLCRRCGENMGLESARFIASLGAPECMMCRMAPPEFERAVAYAEYEAETRELLHLLKFEGRRAVAESVLGWRLAKAIARLEFADDVELVVVPVPLYAARVRERGFNQAELLARAAVRALKHELRAEVRTDVLVRTKDTQALFALMPNQRRARLRGAFAVRRPEAIAGRDVLLVDDILTTGATARECSRVLLRAGAARVWVATVARAQPEGPRLGAMSGFARWEAAPQMGQG